jgi:hypothetical protein
MAIATAVCNSYKQEILEGVHASTDTYKIALYTDAALLDKSTTKYIPTAEVSGLGYMVGGQILKGFRTGLSDSTAFLSFEKPEWKSSTITARGCLIYNASKNNRTVAVFDFGQNVSSINGSFIVDIPSSEFTSLIRIV